MVVFVVDVVTVAVVVAVVFGVLVFFVTLYKFSVLFINLCQSTYHSTG